MTRSLVLGVNGQDGSYLVEALLRRGHEVVGIGRNAESRYVGPSPQFRYVNLDLREPDRLARLIQELAPDYAFHAAAVHGAAGYQYESVWRDMIAVNVSSLHVILEHARTASRGLRVVYAGSCKIFPPPFAGVISETTQAKPSCLYSLGKITSRELITHYRNNHGVAATNLILFHHESPRRPSHYLLPTIARAIADSLADRSHTVAVGGLDFRMDWGAAKEFMDIAVDIGERSEEGEFVLASGTTWYAREAVREIFAHYGLESSRHVVEEIQPSQPPPYFRVQLDRLERAINRRPITSLIEIVEEIVGTLRDRKC